MQIKDINEFEDELTQMSSATLKPVPEASLNKIYCAFDEINDLTSLHLSNYMDSYKSSSNCVYPLKKHDCICYFKEDSAVIYSSGGTKYIVPISIKLKNIFPLEEGLIFQCEYDPDAIKFSLSKDSSQIRAKSYAYLTLNSHPLNDLHPLSVFTGDHMNPFKDLIKTNFELIYMSIDIPLIILYDNSKKELIIGKIHVNNEKEEYLASLDPSKRHPLLPNIASRPHLIIEQIFTTQLPVKPENALIFSGFSKTEFGIAIHYNEKQMIILEAEIQNSKISIKMGRKCENIISITKCEEKYGSENDIMPILCSKNDDNLFSERLGRMRAYLLSLDGNGTIYVFQGNHTILNIDLRTTNFVSFCEMPPFAGLNSIFSVERPIKIHNNKGDWNIDIITDKGKQIKLSLEILQRDNLTNSILQAIQNVIPREIYVSFYSDFLESLHKQDKDYEERVISELNLLKELITNLLHKKDTFLENFIMETPLKRKLYSPNSHEKIPNPAEAWSDLLKSDFHISNSNFYDDLFGKSLDFIPDSVTPQTKKDEKSMSIGKSKENENKLKTNPEEFNKNIERILLILHMLYEDLKLQKCQRKYSEKMALFLFQISICLDESYSPYVEYYIKEHPNLLKYNQTLYTQYTKNIIAKISPDLSIPLKIPPDVFLWISQKLSTGNTSFKIPIFYEHTRTIARIFEILAQGTPGYQISSEFVIKYNEPTLLKLHEGIGKLGNYQLFCNADSNNKPKKNKKLPNDYYLNTEHLNKMEKILKVLLQENISTEDIENNWPHSIALPLYNILWYAREHPLNTWEEKIYQLIGREDIAFNLRAGSQITTSTSHYRRNYYSNQFSPKRNKINTSPESTDKTKQKRIKEAFAGIEVYKELLGNEQEDNDTENKRVNGTNRPKKSIAQYRFTADLRYKEVSVLLDSSKIIKLRTHNIKEEDKVSEEKFEAAKQALLFKMVTRQLSKGVGRGALNYGTLLTLPTETLEIPKISMTGKVPPKDTKIVLDLKDEVKEKELSSWPQFHNGVAAGLRLAKENSVKGGNTRNWIMYQKPKTPNFEHGGFLLAVGLLGYLDCLLSTDIYQYLKTADEPTSIGILIGMSSSKLGSMDDSLSRTICLHIPFLLPPLFEIKITMPTQSAAILGAGLLYFGTSHRLMTEMILSQIGRKPLPDHFTDREVYSLCAGFALGLVNINYAEKAIGLSDLQFDERLIRLIEGGKVMDPPLSMLPANINAESAKCSSVLEGENVNIHITAPGAIMALAIIHMQTDNETIAKKLEIPGTFYALEHAIPFHILLKILARNLIMWSKIEGSTEWLYKQIPTLVREIFESPIKEVQAKYGGTLIAEEEIDYSAIALCYINILSGSILSMGLKYAGTNNKTVLNIICKEIEKLRNMPTTTLKDQNYISYNDKNKNKIDRYSLDNCLCICALSISIIMAGSGDVDCFRTLRVLRKHLETDMNYGHNLAINMCLGFLFLGSGAYTFGQSKKAIAALLCAIYPQFPSSPSDNKYHLQAMRHLYVLALQTRLLQAKDVETGENVQVPLTITYNPSSTISKETFTTPTIINQIDKVCNISLKDPRFYDTQIQNLVQSNNHWTVYVKRRMCTFLNGGEAGKSGIKPKISIANDEDSESNKEFLDPKNWKFMLNENTSENSTLNGDGMLMLFLEKLCKYASDDLISIQEIESALLNVKDEELPTPAELRKIYKVIEKMCDSIKGNIEKSLVKQKLYFYKFAIECLSEGKAEVLPIYLWLLNNMSEINNINPLFLKEYRVLYNFTNILGELFKPIEQHALISRTFLSDISSSIQRNFEKLTLDRTILKTYISHYGILPNIDTAHFCQFIMYNQIPSGLLLSKIMKEMNEELLKCLAKYKPENQKVILCHAVETLKSRILNGRGVFVSEEIKQIVGYLWSLLRNYLPGIDSNFADQFLLMIFEQNKA